MGETVTLRGKQQRFVEEYLIDLNATAAYQRAGYKARGNAAEANASRLLRNAKVAAAIQAAMAQRGERVQVNQDRVLQEIAVLSFSNIWHYTLDAQGYVALAADAPPEAIHAVSSIKRKVVSRHIGDDLETTYETEIKLWDKPAALRMAGLHLGMFVEKREHTGKDGAALPPLQIILTQDK